MKFKLIESSLSTLNTIMELYDVVCISADKYLPERPEFQTQHDYEVEFNSRLGKQRKLDYLALLAKLKSNGYGVIRIKGFYQYSPKTQASKEYSYMVFNKNNDKFFLLNLLTLGEKCKQNSIYYIPKGTFEGSWYYTGVDLSQKDEVDKVHSFGDVEYKGPVHFGSYSINDYGTGYSLVNGRPFSSYQDGEIHTRPIKNNKTDRQRNTQNITIIDESICEEETLSITKNTIEYLKPFREILKDVKQNK